jgi:hypothetical protein
MDPRTGLENVERRKVLPLPGLELLPSTVQPVASRYTDCATPEPVVRTKFHFMTEEHRAMIL